METSDSAVATYLDLEAGTSTGRTDISTQTLHVGEERKKHSSDRSKERPERDLFSQAPEVKHCGNVGSSDPGGIRPASEETPRMKSQLDNTDEHKLPRSRSDRDIGGSRDSATQGTDTQPTLSCGPRALAVTIVTSATQTAATQPAIPNKGRKSNEGRQSPSTERQAIPSARQDNATLSSVPGLPQTGNDSCPKEKTGSEGSKETARKRFLSRFRDSLERQSREPLPHMPFTIGNQIRATLFNSWINFLLFLVPVGTVANYAHTSPVAIFVTNLLAIVPLAAMINLATEEIMIRLGEITGALLNVLFGYVLLFFPEKILTRVRNVVVLMIAIIALANGEVILVQTSLVGSILAQLQLCIGLCFFFGGLRRSEKFFNSAVVGDLAFSLGLAVTSLLVPKALVSGNPAESVPVAKMSRAMSVVLLVLYVCFLLFRLKTHTDNFTSEIAARARRVNSHRGRSNMAAEKGMGDDEDEGNEEIDLLDMEDLPKLYIWVALFALVFSVGLSAFCSKLMVDSIPGVTANGHVSKEFIGLIILPLISHAKDVKTAVTHAQKDKMDLAITIALNSGLQTALFIIPVTIILGWILNNDSVTLIFPDFHVIILFATVVLAHQLLSEGRANWWKGAQLLGFYLFVVLGTLFSPGH